MLRKTHACLAIGCLVAVPSAVGAQAEVTVDVGRPGAKISPTMYGVFFEDINFGADGGLYAELIKNRSFEFHRPLMGWRTLKRRQAVGEVTVLRDAHRPRNPRYARVRVEESGEGFGLSNEGFRGMGIRQGAEYRFSVRARLTEGTTTTLEVEIVGDDRAPLATAVVEGVSSEWQTHRCVLRASGTEAKARLNIWVKGTGKLDIDMVSLFPVDTWKGRENGLRADLVQMLADMKPGFVRFPGGCIVEGFDLANRYQWKNTIGDRSQRVSDINRWNFEFKHRLTPDYFQSFGLGFYEFFLLAEDLGAEPLPIISCGIACQFNSGELVPMDQLDPYIQDVLDLIEFANAPADSKWGQKRAAMGHPESFELKMIGIGNEQWGPQFVERYEVFADAVKSKYPEIQIVSTVGPLPDGERFDYLWKEMKRLKPHIVDEHYYRNPEWFLEQADRYDNYDRSGPKLFAGEYAAQSVRLASPNNRNNWRCALYEAAFMTGLERNADLVVMTSYAPLFAHEEAWQWRPDLIWFDNLNVYGTPNYYVQRLFSLNAGDRVLPTQVGGLSGVEGKRRPLYVSSTLDDKAGEVILKAANVTAEPLPAMIDLKGVGAVGPQAKATVLASEKLTDENSLAEPKKVYPRETSTSISGSRFDYEFQPYSLTVLRLPVKPKTNVVLNSQRQPIMLELEGDLRVHDPVMIRQGDTYYVFCTGGSRRRRGIIPIRCSEDLYNWRRCGSVFEELPAWAREEIPRTRGAWAPDISYFNGEYHLYYSVSTFGRNNSAIGLATNKTLDPDSPDYQWVDHGMVVRSTEGQDDWNAIDGNIVIEDADGVWLSWGSFWSGIKMRRIDPKTGKLSSEDSNLYSLAARPRDRESGNGAVEAPFIVRHEDFWYLFVSFDRCCRGVRSTYKIMVGRSPQVTGPYVDKEGTPMSEGGGTLLLEATTENWRGPGHCAVVQDSPDDYLVFHAYHGDTGRPRLQISTIVWEDGWPRVAELP